jgi:glutaminyl-peptide cyclotransferase
VSWSRWIGAVLVAVLAGSVPPAQAAGTVQQLRAEVLATYPHDTGAFTQGLELNGGRLYEGTGLYGESDVRIVDLETGTVLARVPLPDAYFGEGLTVLGDRIWQLTWQEGTAFRRDRDTLAQVGQASYSGEGWGLCHEPARHRLVMSDGTAELTFRDPETFDEIGTVLVTRDGVPLQRLNELECVAGKVWANVWLTDEIVRIDPVTGQVEAVADASGLLSDSERSAADVLNGIAAVPSLGGQLSRHSDGRFLITGKLWPHVFLVRFSPA